MSSIKYYGLYYGLEGYDYGYCYGYGGGGILFGWVDYGWLLDGLMGRRFGLGRGRKWVLSFLGVGGGLIGGKVGLEGMNLIF